jgi:hypothetical protein
MDIDATFRIVVLAFAVVFLFAYLLRRSSRLDHERRQRNARRHRTGA